LATRKQCFHVEGRMRSLRLHACSLGAIDALGAEAPAYTFIGVADPLANMRRRTLPVP
jgi:hypothetical protein